MKNIIIFIVLIFASFISKGQKEIPPKKSIKTHSISTELFPKGPGIGYSQMLTERISFEIDVTFLASGIGVYYYITNPNEHKFNFYTGLTGAIYYMGFPFYYLPVGISYHGKKNFYYKFDVGIKSSEHVNLLEVSRSKIDNNLGPILGVKVGYQFGEVFEPRKVKEIDLPKNIVSLQFGFSDVVLGGIYERLLTPHLSVEAGLGLIGFSYGSKFYFTSITRGQLEFHVGAIHSFGLLSGLNYAKSQLYLPLGVNLLSKNNYWFSFDVGPIIFINQTEGDLVFPGLTVRLGKAF